MEFVKYVKTNSWFHRLDPRSKLLLCVSIILISFLLTNPFVLALILGFVITLSISAHIGRDFLKRIKILGMVIIVAFILWSFFYKTALFASQQTSEVIFHLGPLRLDVLGLLYGISMPLRILIMIGTPLLLFMTTTFSDLIRGLVELKIPYSVAFILGLSLKLVYSLGKEFETIKSAQMSRGLEVDKGNLLTRVRNYVPILIPFTFKSLELSEQMSIALDLKGFSFEKKKFYKRIKFRWVDWILTTLCFFVLALSIYLRINFNWWL